MTVPSIDLILIAGRAVFLVFCFVLAAVTFTRWRRAADAQTETFSAQNDLVLKRLADLEGRIDATRHGVSELTERVGRAGQAASTLNAPSPGYQIAIRLAKGGASREELISDCGLSVHEAELVQRLHAPRAGAAKARQPAANVA